MYTNRAIEVCMFSCLNCTTTSLTVQPKPFPFVYYYLLITSQRSTALLFHVQSESSREMLISQEKLAPATGNGAARNENSERSYFRRTWLLVECVCVHSRNYTLYRERGSNASRDYELFVPRKKMNF